MNENSSNASLNFFSEDNIIKTLYPKGTTLYLEGGPISGIHFLKRGKIKLFKNEIDGKEIIIKLISSDQFISHRCFFTKKNYTMNAATLEDSEVYFIERTHFLNAFSYNQNLYQNFIEIFNLELIEADNKVSSLMRKNVGQRLAEFLLQLMRENHNDEDKIINLVLSREEIASTIGTSSETVTRYMTKFKEKGLVQEEEHLVRILQPDKLWIRANSPHD